MTDKKKCAAPGDHILHVCDLNNRDHAEVIAGLCTNPRYVCTICGARVNKAENVCQPKELT